METIRADAGQAVVVGPGASPSPGAKGDDVPLAAHDLFNPQEEAFLRAYSESRLRYEAMVAAGYPDADNDEAKHRLVAKAGELLMRVEQLSLAAIGSAVGADKVAYMATLWRWCCCDDGHQAIKALMIMGRVHGLWDKTTRVNQQVALVFAAARPAPGTTPPADLPFTLPSGDYSVFSTQTPDADPENGTTK